MKKLLRYVPYALVVIFIVMQFFRIDKSVPAYNTADDFLTVMQAPAEVASLMRTTCYDCHSYESKYPWYSNVAPVSWWVKGHINEGRKKLNYSLYGTWAQKKRTHKIEETVEAVNEGWMPLDSYKWGHAEARLTDAQRKVIGDWLLSFALPGSSDASDEAGEE